MKNNEIKLEDIFNDKKRNSAKKIIIIHKNTPLSYYLIMIGHRLNDFSYNPVAIMTNIDYFKDCYNNGVGVYSALEGFSEYLDKVV